MAEQYGIRKYLQDNGYADGDITYDQNRKAVLLRGKDFIKANPLAADDPNNGLQAGSTYADRGALSSALNQYRGMNRSTQADTMLGNAMNTVNQQPFQFKAPAEFKYDAQSDPQYQAALRTAQQNAQTAGNNAMVSLGSRGIGNSSITGDRVAQINAKELGRVNDTMLPQMMAQAYQRYADGANRDLQTQQANYGAAQDQFKNQTGLADAFNNLNQQQADNTYRDTALADKQKQDRISLANYLGERFGTNVTPTHDTSLAYDQVAGLQPLDVQKFEEDNRRYGEEIALKRLAEDNNMSVQQAQLAISRQNANTSAASAGTSASNARTSQLMDVWKSTGQAPAGLESLGVQPGTAFTTGASPGGTPGKPVKVDSKSSADNYDLIFDDLQTPNLSKEKARQLVESNRDNLTDADYSKLKKHINDNF